MMQVIIVLSTMIVVGTILYGVKTIKSNKSGNLRTQLLTSVGLFAATVVAFVVVGADQVVLAAATETANNAASTGMTLGEGFKYLAAALSTGIATIGTGVAVGSVGSSAIGAVSEDSSVLGKTLIFVGMAEGIAIYGMIISILILFV